MSEEYRQLEDQYRKISERRDRQVKLIVEMEANIAHMKEVIKDADIDLIALKVQLDALRSGGDRSDINGSNQ